MPKQNYIAFICVALSLLLSCSTQQYSSKNHNYAASRDVQILPDLKLFQSSPDTTLLFFKINTRNLLYARENKDGEFLAKIKVEIEALTQPGDKVTIFADSSLFTDRDNDQKVKDLIGSMVVPVSGNKDFFIRVSWTDLNRNNTESRVIRSLRSEKYIDRQGFMPFIALNDVPLVSKYVLPADSIHLKYRDPDVNTIYWSFFEALKFCPPPPFDTENNYGKALSRINGGSIEVENGIFPFKTGNNEGIYYFSSDSQGGAGTTLFIYPSGFPYITNGSQMIEPLRYICSREEFLKLDSADNKKLAADEFWINRCGSKERAKEVIKVFYNRVEDANKYFTGMQEGWRTDRGMIYLIFGQPDAVYLREQSETWVYGQDANVMSVNFTFVRKENPFTDNHFELQRSQSYRNFWYTAVEYWRSGQIFSL